MLNNPVEDVRDYMSMLSTDSVWIAWHWSCFVD